ncbi:hypothetical protein LXK86_00590, partial [Klebsiella pneumoniae]|uniref:hypothetical protein n=1 Tax=Klebsiella pneumoniae TaxID=573 RepID=UPI001F448B37
MGCADGCAATTNSGSATVGREMSECDCSELTAVSIIASGGDAPGSTGRLMDVPIPSVADYCVKSDLFTAVPALNRVL